MGGRPGSGPIQRDNLLHQQAEAVRVGPEGIAVLCSANPMGDGEQTRLIRLSDDGEVGWERHCAPEQGAGRAIAALSNGGFGIAGDGSAASWNTRRNCSTSTPRARWSQGAPSARAGVTGFVAVTVLKDASTLAGDMADGRGWLLCVD